MSACARCGQKLSAQVGPLPALRLRADRRAGAVRYGMVDLDGGRCGSASGGARCRGARHRAQLDAQQHGARCARSRPERALAARSQRRARANNRPAPARAQPVAARPRPRAPAPPAAPQRRPGDPGAPRLVRPRHDARRRSASTPSSAAARGHAPRSSSVPSARARAAQRRLAPARPKPSPSPSRRRGDARAAAQQALAEIAAYGPPPAQAITRRCTGFA